MKNPFHLIFYLVLVFPFTPTRAQVTSADPQQVSASIDPQQDLLSALPSVTISIKASRDLIHASANSLFSHFEVIDERPDTARIGVHTNMKTFRRPYDRQLVFDRPAALAVAAWLNNHFSRPGAPYTALIVLRSLCPGPRPPLRKNPYPAQSRGLRHQRRSLPARYQVRYPAGYKKDDLLRLPAGALLRLGQ